MKMIPRNTRSAACIAFLCAASDASLAGSVNAPTNTVSAIDLPSTNSLAYLYPIEMKQTPQTWPEIWRDEFSSRSQVIAYDAFGPPSRVSWIRGMDNGYSFNAMYIDAGKRVVERSAVNSLRESIVRLPGIIQSRNVFSDFLIGTIAGTTEESLRPTSPILTGSQMSWWQEMRSNGAIRYGSHFFDGDVLYGSVRFGRLRGQPLGIAFARWHCDPFAMRSKVEGNVSWFLPLRTALTIGGSYDIARINSSRNAEWSVSVSHFIGKDWRDGIVSAGIWGNNEIWNIRAGISFQL